MYACKVQETTVVWALPARQGEGGYYQFVAEQLGALFLLLWDVSPGPRPEAGVRLVLLNRQWPDANVRSSVQGFASVQLERELRHPVTCFARVVVGTGCRAVWWDSAKFPFDPPVYADFLGLENNLYASAQPLGRLAPAHPRSTVSPVRFFLRPFLLRQLLRSQPDPALPQQQHHHQPLSSGWDMQSNASSGLFPAASPYRLLRPLRVVLASRAHAPKRRLLSEPEIVLALLRRFPADALGSIHVLDTSSAGGGPGDQARPNFPRDPRVSVSGAATLAQQAAACASANVIIGLHGAGLSNMVYLQRGSLLVELTGPHRHGCANRFFFSKKKKKEKKERKMKTNFAREKKQIIKIIGGVDDLVCCSGCTVTSYFILFIFIN
jgi:hypothetical protein